MEKSSCMDLDMEDWELLQVPNDSHTTTFDLGLESGGKEDPNSTDFVPVAAFVDNHYFILPSKNQEFLKNSTKVAREEEEELESLVEFKDIGVVEHSPPELSTREDIVAARIGPEPIHSGDDEEEEEEEEEEEGGYVDHDDKEKREEECGLKVWRWKLVGGVGALCSVGVAAAAAAAAICVLVLGGGRHLPNYETHSQTQRFPFQIYADEKRIKHAVQQASRLNQALTAARAVPKTTTTTTTTTATATGTRANISFGGYYDGL